MVENIKLEEKRRGYEQVKRKEEKKWEREKREEEEEERWNGDKAEVSNFSHLLFMLHIYRGQMT